MSLLYCKLQFIVYHRKIINKIIISQVCYCTYFVLGSSYEFTEFIWKLKSATVVIYRVN